jgi:hypothetical protein
MSVTFSLAVLLAPGFGVVGIVGFFGLRERMRRDDDEPARWSVGRPCPWRCSSSASSCLLWRSSRFGI